MVTRDHRLVTGRVFALLLSARLVRTAACSPLALPCALRYSTFYTADSVRRHRYFDLQSYTLQLYGERVSVRDPTATADALRSPRLARGARPPAHTQQNQNAEARHCVFCLLHTSIGTGTVFFSLISLVCATLISAISPPNKTRTVSSPYLRIFTVSSYLHRIFVSSKCNPEFNFVIF